MVAINNKIGLNILKLISLLKYNYGKSRLINIILNRIDELSVYQIKEILFQLIEQGYLKEKDVGTNFPINVIILSEKGKEAVNNKKDIILNFENINTTEFKPATDIEVIDKETLNEFYNIKKNIFELQKKEEELKETIKKIMIEKKVSEIQSDNMYVYCKNVKRIIYPKEKIEKLIPEELLNKIRTKSEIIVLSTKLK